MQNLCCFERSIDIKSLKNIVAMNMRLQNSVSRET